VYAAAIADKHVAAVISHKNHVVADQPRALLAQLLAFHLEGGTIDADDGPFPVDIHRRIAAALLIGLGDTRSEACQGYRYDEQTHVIPQSFWMPVVSQGRRSSATRA
jgi:hypothetical protein